MSRTSDPILFAGVTASDRQRLAESSMGGLRPGEKVVDLFCGAGGWGEGAKTLGIPVDYAVNHWPVAIDTHRTNNPATQHHLGDAWRARPRSIIGGAKLGLLLASAACTTHSRARGAAPVSKRVHMLGWCIARWMKEAQPRLVLIENVPEWKDWGPLIPKRDDRGRAMKDDQGRAIMVQDPARKGKHYRALLRYMRRLGYAVEEFICDAPDFGEASRRKRLFIQARDDGQPIVWPERTHGRSDPRGFVGPTGRRRRTSACSRLACANDISPPRLRGDSGGVGRVLGRGQEEASASLCQGDGDRVDAGSRDGASGNGGPGSHLHPYRSAASCIDWSDLGRSIFDRRQPLKPKTQARIAEGIRRYVIKDPAPFVLRVTQAGGKGWYVSPIDQPLPTQTTRQDVAVATPVMATTRNGEREGQAPRCHAVTDPLMTVTGGAVQGVATPILAPQNTGVYGGRVDQPGPAVTTKGHQALISPILSPAGGPDNQPHRADEPMRTVLGRESFGVATPVIAVCAHGDGKDSTKRWGRPALPITDPLNAIHAGGNNFGLATPILAGAGGSEYAGKPTRADAPLGTVKCDDRRGVATPVLMNNTTGHTGGRVDEPAPTVTTGGQTGLVTPIVAYAHHGGGQHSDARAPLNAIMAGGTHAGLVAPMLSEYHGSGSGDTLRPADQPMGAVTTIQGHAAVNVVMSSWELALERGRRVARWLVEHLGDAVPIDEETGLAYTLIEGVRRFFVDVLFRMLKPRELARAMGFPDSYEWPKNRRGTIHQRDTVRLIGNAVSVRTARALLGACLPRGVIRRRRSA